MNYRLGAATAALVLMAAAAQAATTDVNVTLTDTTSVPPAQGMQIAANPGTIKAGTVRFHVVNQSKTVTHEMIVVRVKSPDETLPAMARADRIDEKKISHLGEVANLKPGKSGNLRLALKAGNYLLICNETGHFHQGMKTAFTVTP